MGTRLLEFGGISLVINQSVVSGIGVFMSLGDTKVKNANIVDHIDSYDELVSRLASMTMILESSERKLEPRNKK